MDLIGAHIPQMKEKEEVKTKMNRIHAKSETEIADSDIAQKMSDLNIPYVDLGNSPITQRSVTKDGDIIDIVTETGEKAESWSVEVPGQVAMRIEDDKHAASFKKLMTVHPLITLD